MVDTDSILHPAPFSESVSDIIAKALDSWDVVRHNFDLIENTLSKVVNKIIRKQNEIHSRIVQSRPWGNCEYRVVKFDYLGDHFKIKIVQCRDVITGEVPIEQIAVPKHIVLGAHNQETFEAYFKEYETNLNDKHVLDLENRKLLNAEILRRDFEAAKEFYFQHKDHFEQMIAEAQKNLLSYDEWEKIYYTRNTVSEDDKKVFHEHHNLDLDAEIEKIKKQEYELYVQRVNLGIE